MDEYNIIKLHIKFKLKKKISLIALEISTVSSNKTILWIIKLSNFIWFFNNRHFTHQKIYIKELTITRKGDDNIKIWNPVCFFISLFMSFLMPLIFAVPMGSKLDIVLIYWPLRWLVTYLLITLIVNPTSFALAKKVFNFNPMK